MPKIPVKAARVAAKLTQEEMAKKLDITPSWYNVIERDPSKMAPYHFYAILYLTGFTADDIILPTKSSET
jgi:DNA-binding XRE family transcriptional regulator